MAVRWQDVDVSERPPFDGQRQRDALTRFQGEAGIDATVAARAVNLSYPQYNRYLWGRLPLRTDQIPAFAAAYGVATATLTRALGLLDEPADDASWDFLAALRRAVPDPSYVEQAFATGHDAPRDIQRIIVETAGEAYRAGNRASRKTRAIAEERAKYTA